MLILLLTKKTTQKEQRQPTRMLCLNESTNERLSYFRQSIQTKRETRYHVTKNFNGQLLNRVEARRYPKVVHVITLS